MDKRKLGIVFTAFIGFCIFGLSFYYCWNRLNTIGNINKPAQVKSKSQDALWVQSKVYDIVMKNTKIVFKTKYNKCGTVVTDIVQPQEDLTGKTREELNNIYSAKGYKVSTMSGDMVIMVRELDRYEPNKYVLGIKDGYIAIYKTDKDGNMFIQDVNTDITDIKASSLKDEDIKLLTKGDKYFQCSTKEDAQAILEDYE